MTPNTGKKPPRYRVGTTAKQILDNGLRNRWYGICTSDVVADRPIPLKRWNRDLVIWRDGDSKVHLQDDRCPHRGAPLSIARHDGDRLTCAYHGIEILGDGRVAKVPGNPGSELVGKVAVHSYTVQEHRGVVFAWLGDDCGTPVAPLALPERLTSDAYDAFLAYAEWRCPYRFIIDNNMDPMHGVFLHQISHSMGEGATEADFQTRKTNTGFIFEKKNQKGVNFDWSEWYDVDFQAVCLEIPYPLTGGPGGSFGIVFHTTPIDDSSSVCFFWRHRKVSGWERATWRFLYKNRLEGRHWHVLEQDRLVAERMAEDADRNEYLYSHDAGVVRVRKLMADEAVRQAQGIDKDVFTVK
ncbi:MAG: aromatic ring-hydroxylating dioxygenase subunit alpha [Pseudomonadota bacterium]|nr:aromatic ring-hydroxylating dioxygenase subunit alpha [Pseudomonadota bacterium]